MLAIAGGKGGVGKTTTALGLADALPGRPLVVDADRDVPNLHALAGVEPGPTLAALRDGDPHEDLAGDTLNAVAREAPGLDCRVVAAASGDDPRTDRVLHRLTAEVNPDGPTLLDCPAGAGPAAVGPLRVARAVVLVTTLCAPAVRDTAKTAAMARALDVPVAGVVLVRTRLCPGRVVDDLECPVLGTVPEVRPPVLESAAVREAYASVARRLEAVTGPELTGRPSDGRLTEV